MEQFILSVLSGYGLAGLVILALGWTVLQQQRALNKLNQDRLGDIPILITALQNNTQATNNQAEAIKSRNAVTEELSKAMERQALVFELFMQKTDLLDKGHTDRLHEFKLVIDSIADAMRTNTAMVREIRDRSDEPLPRKR